MIESNPKTYWLISSNDDRFNIEQCLMEHDVVDWQTSFKATKGDIVFIYRSKSVQRICYKLEVLEAFIKDSGSYDESKYWGKKHRTDNDTSGDGLCHRLKLLAKSDSKELNLKSLLKMGLNYAPIGPVKLKGQLLEYIMSKFEETTKDYDEYDSVDGYFEGALKKVFVNRYERDREAREKCIAKKGCKCSVCEMDFEKVYGEIGRGFIHVHHIVPISSIGAEYLIDPEKDYVPVCPNCHAMLHHGKDGEVLTIEELKKQMNRS